MVLRVRGLLPLINGTDKAPADEKTAEYEAWSDRDQEALAQISLTLSDEPLNTVLDETTSKAAWSKLMTRYEGKGEQKIALLISELFRSTLSDGSPLEPQINVMTRTAHQLSALGLTLEERIIAIAIIISLPPSYDTLKTILTASKAADMTVEYVRSQVKLEEQRRNHDADSNTAFAARSGNNQRGGRFGSRGRGRNPPYNNRQYCTHCKLNSHKTEDCRKLKAEQEKSNATARVATDSTALHAQVRSDDGDNVRLFRATEKVPTRSDLTDRWLVDSGASRIMSSHRDWFQSYQPLKPPCKVWLGDNSYILAQGVGQILVRMRADHKWSRILLQDVLHVPDLHGNLLSVSALARRGARIQFLNETCEIVDKTGHLTCVGNLEDNLYILDTQTVTECSAIIARHFPF